MILGGGDSHAEAETQAAEGLSECGPLRRGRPAPVQLLRCGVSHPTTWAPSLGEAHSARCDHPGPGSSAARRHRHERIAALAGEGVDDGKAYADCKARGEAFS